MLRDMDNNMTARTIAMQAVIKAMQAMGWEAQVLDGSDIEPHGLPFTGAMRHHAYEGVTVCIGVNDAIKAKYAGRPGWARYKAVNNSCLWHVEFATGEETSYIVKQGRGVSKVLVDWAKGDTHPAAVEIAGEIIAAAYNAERDAMAAQAA